MLLYGQFSESCLFHQVKVKVKSCLTLCHPVGCSLPGSSIHGISRQEYWSGLPFPLQVIFPTQGLNSGLLHCRQMLYPLSHQGP